MNKAEADRSGWWYGLARIGFLLAGLLGIISLAGWFFDIAFLPRFGPEKILMAPSTALLFLIFGAAGALNQKPGVQHRYGRIPLQLVFTGLFIAVVLLVLSRVGIEPGIEHLGINIKEVVSGPSIGHTAILTAVCFILVGVSQVLLILPEDSAGRKSKYAFWFTLLLFLISISVLTAYLLGEPLLIGTGINPPALTTSLAFQIVSCSLLCLILLRMGLRERDDQNHYKSGGWKLVAVFFAVVVIILCGAYLYFSFYVNRFRIETGHNLSVVADLKLNELVQWRRERVGDAMVFHDNPAFSQLVDRILANPEDRVSRESLQSWLNQVRGAYQYDQLSLLDSSGARLLGSPKNQEDGGSHIDSVLEKAFSYDEIQFLDLHLHADGKAYLGLVVPIASFRHPGKWSGALLLRIDPEQYLFPLIRRWPAPSETAETLLVRREGDGVLFLNDLRFLHVAPMTLRLPLVSKDLPAARAVLGEEGLVEGIDYRGFPVLAVIRKVPDSPWFIVARMDLSEISAPLRERLWWIVLLVNSLVILVGAVVGAVWQMNVKSHYRQIWRFESRYGTTLNSIGEGVIVSDSEGRIELLNPVAANLTGWVESEALGQPLNRVFRIVDEDTRQPILDPVERVLETGIIVGLANHTLLLSRDGREIPIFDTGAPIHGEGGEIAGVVLAFSDQTEDRRMRRKLLEREQKYRGLFNSIRDAILVVDTDRRIQDCNPAFTELFGYELNEIIGEKSRFIYENEEDFLQLGEAIQRNIDSPGFLVSIPYKTKSGYVFPSEAAVYYLKNAVGEITGYIGMFRDVSERIRFEKEITESETKYRSLIESSPDAILISSRGKVIFVNRACMELFGAREDELIGKPALELFHPDFHETVRKRLMQLGKGSSRVVPLVEERIVRLDGGIVDVEAISTSFPIEGENQIHTILRDITERQRQRREREALQEQLAQAQKLDSIGRLAGGIAHDFNNLLSIIIGNVELAMDKVGEGDPLKEDLDGIYKSALRSAELTRQLLAFARKQTIDPKVLDLNRTLEKTLSMLRRLIGEDIDLSWKPGSDLWPLKMDPAQIDQILANLCVNARDAISGVGKITIETGNVEIDQDYCEVHEGFIAGEFVSLTVSDNGYGIDQDAMQHLFEPFFTTKKDGEGTGLGLATVFGIVKQNQGFINVYSEPGRGSTFRIYLPRYQGNESVKSGEDQPMEKAYQGSGTILLVEDEPSLLNMGKLMLERLGYKVITANNAGAALEAAREEGNDFSLLITDVIMPEMDGRELTRRLKELRPDLKTLFMSGYTANVIAHHGVLEAGVHFMEKPFSLKSLNESVRKALEDD